MARIRAQQEVAAALGEGRLPEWQADAYRELCAKVDDDAFPCTFGTRAWRNGAVRFAFAESPDSPRLADDLAAILGEYARFVTARGSVYAALRPLAILMPPPSGWRSLEDYRAGSWRLLQRVHRRDPSAWPDRVPRDPDSPRWSFCFAGVPFFVNFKTPLHRRRRSRRLGAAYAWLVQARDGFDQLAGDNAAGRAARREIRDLLADYDEVPMHPALAHYGTPENREWRQYFLDDDNADRQRCPFATGDSLTPPAPRDAPGSAE